MSKKSLNCLTTCDMAGYKDPVPRGRKRHTHHTTNNRAENRVQAETRPPTAFLPDQITTWLR